MSHGERHRSDLVLESVSNSLLLIFGRCVWALTRGGTLSSQLDDVLLDLGGLDTDPISDVQPVD